MSEDAPTPDTAGAVRFLLRFAGSCAANVVAITPDTGKVEARTFTHDEAKALQAWIDARQGVANLYFHVNRLKTGVRHRKAKKDDVDAVLWLHVDIDNKEALERINRFIPRATITIFSGGGYQAFWGLSEELADLERAEVLNAAIAVTLGGDNCQNVDQIMRVPGTINVPNAKEQAAGRVPTLAYVVEEKWDRSYSPDEFEKYAELGRKHSHRAKTLPSHEMSCRRTLRTFQRP